MAIQRRTVGKVSPEPPRCGLPSQSVQSRGGEESPCSGHVEGMGGQEDGGMMSGDSDWRGLATPSATIEGERRV